MMSAMPQRSVLLPGDFVDTKQQDLGAFVLSRMKLEKLHIATPKIICIPHTTLKLIADANNISVRLSSLLHDISFSDPVSVTKITKTVTELITKATIPVAITQELAQKYHSQFKSGAVRIFAGDSPEASLTTPFTRVKGDATVFQFFLACWAHTVQKRILNTRSRYPHLVLFSCPIVIEEEPEIQVQGHVYTRNPKTGDKTIAYIVSSPSFAPKSSATHTYEVDVRTWNILKRDLGVHTTHTAQGLSDTLLKAIAQLANTIKKQYLAHQKIGWIVANNALYCTSIEEYTHLHEPAATHQRTVTQLYVSAGNPQQHNVDTQTPIDGIGLLKSEYTYLKYGTHPYALLKGHGKELLYNSLLDAITSLSDSVHGKLVLLRSHDFTSQDLQRLNHATTYESVESNPFLGHRGGLRSTLQPALFDLELEVLKAFTRKSSGSVGLLLPFVRTPAELNQLIAMVEETNLRSHAHFSLWWQLDTPENLLNCSSYPLRKIDGLSVHVTNVQSLLYGIDPANREVYERYTPDSTLVTTLISKLLNQRATLQETNTLTHNLPIVAQFEEYDPRLVQELVQLGIDGITVKPNVAPLAKACIIDTEAQPLQEKKRTALNTIVL